MSAFELYEKYLHNSISFGSQDERNKRILHEKEELNKMINALSNMFYKDKDIINKSSRSIYSLMKNEMARRIVEAGDKYENVIVYYQFYLREILASIGFAHVS